jgi:hypothetical protein
MCETELEKHFNTAVARFGSNPPWERRQQEESRRRSQRLYLWAAELEIHRGAGNIIHRGARYSLLINRPAPEKLAEADRASGL